MLLCDEELAAMVKNGDGAAFDVLMERFMPYLRFKSRIYFCAGIESDDLLQEARIGLYIACVNYNKSRNTLFSTFAQLCISRRINSAKRRAFSMKNSMLNEYLPIYQDETLEQLCDEALEELGNDPDIMPESHVIYAELKQTVDAVVEETLSEKEKLYFSDYITGFRCAEIARKYGADAKSVDNALTRAKKKVRRKVSEFI